MERKVPFSDFEGQLNRRSAQDWGADVTRNSIAANSDFALDSERLRTQGEYVPSAQERRNAKMGRFNPMAPRGTFVERPVDVQRSVRRFMGKQVYRSDNKPFDQE